LKAGNKVIKDTKKSGKGPYSKQRSKVVQLLSESVVDSTRKPYRGSSEWQADQPTQNLTVQLCIGNCLGGKPRQKVGVKFPLQARTQ